jgi:hypothetical protein
MDKTRTSPSSSNKDVKTNLIHSPSSLKLTLIRVSTELNIKSPRYSKRILWEKDVNYFNKYKSIEGMMILYIDKN